MGWLGFGFHTEEAAALLMYVVLQAHIHFWGEGTSLPAQCDRAHLCNTLLAVLCF